MLILHLSGVTPDLHQCVREDNQAASVLCFIPRPSVQTRQIFLRFSLLTYFSGIFGIFFHFLNSFSNLLQDFGLILQVFFTMSSLGPLCAVAEGLQDLALSEM